MLHSPFLQALLVASRKTLVLPITWPASSSIISFHGFIASRNSSSEEFTNSNYICYSFCNCFNSVTPVVETRIRTQIDSQQNFSVLCSMLPGHTQPPIQLTLTLIWWFCISCWIHLFHLLLTEKWSWRKWRKMRIQRSSATALYRLQDSLWFT